MKRTTAQPGSQQDMHPGDQGSCTTVRFSETAIEGLPIHPTLGSFSFLLKPPDLRLDGPKFVG